MKNSVFMAIVVSLILFFSSCGNSKTDMQEDILIEEVSNCRSITCVEDSLPKDSQENKEKESSSVKSNEQPISSSTLEKDRCLSEDINEMLQSLESNVETYSFLEPMEDERINLEDEILYQLKILENCQGFMTWEQESVFHRLENLFLDQ